MKNFYFEQKKSSVILILIVLDKKGDLIGF